MSSTKHCVEKKSNKIGHHARVRDAMGQPYSIYACTRFRGHNLHPRVKVLCTLSPIFSSFASDNFFSCFFLIKEDNMYKKRSHARLKESGHFVPYRA